MSVSSQDFIALQRRVSDEVERTAIAEERARKLEAEITTVQAKVMIVKRADFCSFIRHTDDYL